MGLTESFKSASVFGKVAVIVLLLCNFFNWLAFTTTYWTPGSGLWRSCSTGGITASCSFNDGNDVEYFQATQAFVSIGFIGVNIAFFIAVLYVFVPQCMKSAEIAFWGGILAIVTAVCYFIGILIFGIETSDRATVSILDWSFILAVVAFVLEVVGGLFLFLAGKR